MTKNQYIETGKGFIALANLIGGLSVINGLFGNKDISIPEIFMIFYTFVALYIAGNMLIKKGEYLHILDFICNRSFNICLLDNTQRY